MFLKSIPWECHLNTLQWNGSICPLVQMSYKCQCVTFLLKFKVTKRLCRILNTE